MAHLNRVVQRREGDVILRSLPTEQWDCAEISGGYWGRYRFRSYERFDFPDHDICTGPFTAADGSPRHFDMVIADQVWEHLDRPYAATRHVLQMLRPGGVFYIAVPFYVRYHPYPVDCSRWTARGLRNLLVEAGFDAALITADQWGNVASARRDCGKRWAAHDGLTDDLTNDPDFPTVAWALARKAVS